MWKVLTVVVLIIVGVILYRRLSSPAMSFDFDKSTGTLRAKVGDLDISYVAYQPGMGYSLGPFTVQVETINTGGTTTGVQLSLRKNGTIVRQETFWMTPQ